MATAAATKIKRAYTAEQFARMPSSRTKGYELIDGELRKKGMGAASSRVNNLVGFRVTAWALAADLGAVFDSECQYACFPGAPRVRKPDVSFVRYDRMPEGDAPPGMFLIPPDFAAEVVSPGDEVGDLDQKVVDYRTAGIPLIWVVHPVLREVHVYRAGERPQIVGPDGELVGDPVLPGFRVRVADLFPAPRPTPQTSQEGGR